MPPTRSKKSPAHPTLTPLVEAWAKQGRWQQDRQVAKDFIAALGHLSPRDLNPLMIGALVATWRKRHKPSTCYAYRSKLANLLGALVSFGAPILKPPKLPPPRPRGVVATGNELTRLLADPQPWLRLFILLYLQCGLRKHEALAVTPRTWNRENHTVTIPIKGGRIRTAQVTDDVEILFLAAGDPDPDTTYISALRGRKVNDSGMGQAWTALKKRTGINPTVTAHDLRRTSATILYTATKDLRVPQQLLGHQDLTSTLRYLAPMAPDEARKYTDLLRFHNFKSTEKPQ